MDLYEDFDVWEKHYKDWKNILENMKPDVDLTKDQYDYRKKLFKRLIKEWEDRG